MIRIKEAIAHFNREEKPDKKMTQGSLSEKVLIEDPNTAGYYMSRWANGEEYGKLKPLHIVRICNETKVDANFLFGTKPMNDGR